MPSRVPNWGALGGVCGQAVNISWSPACAMRAHRTRNSIGDNEELIWGTLTRLSVIRASVALAEHGRSTHVHY